MGYNAVAKICEEEEIYYDENKIWDFDIIPKSEPAGIYELYIKIKKKIDDLCYNIYFTLFAGGLFDAKFELKSYVELFDLKYKLTNRQKELIMKIEELIPNK